jgi:hypothetical protein
MPRDPLDIALAALERIIHEAHREDGSATALIADLERIAREARAEIERAGE